MVLLDLLFLGYPEAKPKHIKSAYYICAPRGGHTIGMADGSSAEQNLNYAIARLKEIKEEIEMLQGMFATINKWSGVTGSTRNKIDSALYELTGSDFYRPEKEGPKRQ